MSSSESYSSSLKMTGSSGGGDGDVCERSEEDGSGTDATVEVGEAVEEEEGAESPSQGQSSVGTKSSVVIVVLRRPS